MRLFIAIELPETVRAHLADVQNRVRRGHPDRRAGWVRPENLHLTLKFLGDVVDRDVPTLCDALATPALPAPTELCADHLDCLPPHGAVRVIAAGVVGDLPVLRAIHAAIDDACDPLGFPRERRQFRPHITLGRAKPFGPKWPRENLGADAPWPGPSFRPESFVLMESHLSPHGSTYLPLAHFRLS